MAVDKGKIIMGIDPGTNIMGYGIISIQGQQIKLLSAGVVKLGHLKNHYLKLKRIYEKTLALVDQYKPLAVAIEAPFFGKNVQSMLKLGRAQGTAIAAVLAREVDVTEYAPKKIKQAVTGRGTSTKEQVAAMLEHILNTKLSLSYLDATDGLAAAVCHYYQMNNPQKGTNKSGWSTFIKENPGRIIPGSS